ncbi:MAG: hypothetical protein HY901_34840 [Deltaproteobacteria bacterium]|nr:hypothetical protein [Deltaproteobacteria bacterium]
MTNPIRLVGSLVVLFSAFGLIACSSDEVSSDEAARRAYLGLDKSVSKALQLGFAGFNAASSANISPQTAAGDLSGTITITGQVDQGSSDNKGMRLKVGMVGYSDGRVILADEEESIAITYATDASTDLQPALTLSLRNIPSGTFTGTLAGKFSMTGDLSGAVELNLNLAGELEADTAGKVQRKAGTTTIRGTAISGDGTYQVDVKI